MAKNETKCKNNEINRKAESAIRNTAKFARQHIVMRVVQDR